jgi:hypothetical protein
MCDCGNSGVMRFVRNYGSADAWWPTHILQAANDGEPLGLASWIDALVNYFKSLNCYKEAI